MRIVPETSDDVSILLSDISPCDEIANFLNERGGVGLLDHHKTAIPLLRYPWAKVDTTKSGALMIYEMLSSRFNIDDLYPLVDLANTRDLWIQDDKEKFEHARNLTILLGLMGREKFISRFMSDSSPELYEEEVLLIECDTERMMRYVVRSIQLAQVVNGRHGHLFARVVSDQYTSEVGNYLLEAFPQIEFALTVDMREMSCHVRGRGNLDLSQLAKEYGGGGHPRAAGFPLRPDTLSNMEAITIEETKVEEPERDSDREQRDSSGGEFGVGTDKVTIQKSDSQG
jgi:oligoribonuclease NrnB/cAMP/cGMP phosphodiesterase (DHH superfamily)